MELYYSNVKNFFAHKWFAFPPDPGFKIRNRKPSVQGICVFLVISGLSRRIILGTRRNLTIRMILEPNLHSIISNFLPSSLHNFPILTIWS
jgi:hypothetical protein